MVVGAGSVGATYCYSLAQSGLADEIVLIDRNQDILNGQVLDLVHGQPFFPTVNIRSGSSEDFSDAQLVVITAGASADARRDEGAAFTQECRYSWEYRRRGGVLELQGSVSSL